MEQRFKSTVLKLSANDSYIHFSCLKKQNKFGCHALFKNEDASNLYDVTILSKSLLRLNHMWQQIQEMIKIYKSLKSNMVCGLLEVIQMGEMMYVVCRAFEWTLKDLIEQRQGLTQYQIVYFVSDLYQMMHFFRTKNCFFEKIDLEDIYISKDRKIVIGFNTFVNAAKKKPIIKRLPFRSQYRNRNNCPDLFFGKEIEQRMIDEINAWNIGILTYQLLQNKAPFQFNHDDIISKCKSCKCNKDVDKLFSKQYQLNFKNQNILQKQLRQFISGLLKFKANERTKFSLILIEPFFKKFPTVPHILPSTIFHCPPSQAYKEQYYKKFLKDESKGIQQNKEIKMQTISQANQVSLHHKNEPETPFLSRTKIYHKTLHNIAESQRTLSETQIYIEQFVDISHVYGYGYHMNTGAIAFVFNDETEYFYPKGFTKEERYIIRIKNKKHQQKKYRSTIIPDEQDHKKKLIIIEAFSKNLKRNSQKNNEKQKNVMVEQYAKTKYASLFLLSNDSVQIFFNDKINFLMSKTSLMVQLKNSGKYEPYEIEKQQNEMNTRRRYCITMAKKIFLWEGGDSIQEPFLAESVINIVE